MIPYYSSNSITLFKGDCREVVPQLPEHDLLHIDPPYAINAARHRNAAEHGWVDYGKAEEASWDLEKPDKATFDMIRGKCKRAIIWGGNYFADCLPPTMMWLVWSKMQTDFSLADGELAWTSEQKALRILNYSRASATRESNRVHPTQKSVIVLVWAMKHFLPITSVLDCYAGSGSTGEACIQMGIPCTLVERETRYCDLIAERMQKAKRVESSGLMATKKVMGFGV